MDFQGISFFPEGIIIGFLGGGLLREMTSFRGPKAPVHLVIGGFWKIRGNIMNHDPSMVHILLN